jgi:hypothetical protein
MGYTLKEFCEDHHELLTSGQPPDRALPQIAEKLSVLLRNPDFVAEAFKDDAPVGRRTLAHDPDTDVYVLAHVYDTARAVTNMTEWRRVNSAGEEQAVLEPVEHYALGPGQTRAYGPGVLHSTEHPGRAWVIRVTGTDVDAIPRFRYKPERDRIVEKV